MRFSRKILMALFATSTLAGCKPIESIKERAYFGQLRGIDACFKIHASDLISEDDTRRFCARKHERWFSHWTTLDGRATIESERIAATINNRTPDKVVTYITANATHYKQDGAKEAFTASGDAWIAPGASADVVLEFTVDVSVAFASLPFCNNSAAESTFSDCKTWSIVEARGVDF